MAHDQCYVRVTVYSLPAVPSYTMKLKWLFTAGILETYTTTTKYSVFPLPAMFRLCEVK
jgi:hypothetical protein